MSKGSDIPKQLAELAASLGPQGKRFIMIHVGSDFDTPSASMLGRGEPGGIRPLGNGLYGYLLRKPEDLKPALDYARLYHKYAPGDPTLHAFSLDMKPGEVGIAGNVWDESLLDPSQAAHRSDYATANDLPVGPERQNAFDSLTKKYPESESDRRVALGKLPFRTQQLPAGPIEISVQDLSRLKSLMKWPASASDDELTSALAPYLKGDDMVPDKGYAKGGDITSALAKLAKLLGRSGEQAASAVERSAPVSALSDLSGGTGRSTPRDPRMEQLQSLVTNQPTDGGNYQWAVTKPNGQIHGAPFDFKGSALNVADNLNKQVAGHTVQAIPSDLAPLDRFTPRPSVVDPMRKATADEIDQLLSSGQSPGMAEGGSFDPVSAAASRVRGQSSPGTPGISGALRDALEALKSYFTAGREEFGDEADQSKMSQVETQSHADGGTTGVSTEHEQGKAGLAKRFGVRVMEQAYGLDDQGKPALGGRAWTQGQGGTPAGILDEISAVPHNLLNLMHTTRALDPIRKHLPGNAEGQQAEDSFFDSVDPQWSKDAADRLDRLRSSMNREYGVGEAHSFPEHMTDAAASLVSPVPMAAEGREAGAAGRLLEMTMPLRPRTLKNAAQDTAVLGGVGTGIDSLMQRLQRLHAQSQPQGGGQQADPEQFSHDMGVQPEQDRDIHNNHEMVPLVGPDGNVVFGVDPQTFGKGGNVRRSL